MGRLGELLVILAIVFLLFGTKRLKDFGSDLGSAIKGFKKSIADEPPKSIEQNEKGTIIEGKAETVHNDSAQDNNTQNKS
ncbi:MAG TPA: twin-arginine translocase TatA/TatE family subunit [Spongiibacteraceae bacterium]|nr:twin-arginine translocase TatA/TatE family subunit [Spongiibacteraceae bacterium]